MSILTPHRLNAVPRAKDFDHLRAACSPAVGTGSDIQFLGFRANETKREP